MKRVVAGPNPVFEAVGSNPTSINVVYLADGLRQGTVKKLEGACKKARIRLETISRSSLDEICAGLNHQGVAALTGSYPYVDMEAVVEGALASDNPLLVILDQLQDPGNLGAIVRTAHSLGASGILMTRDRSAEMTPAAVRASAGASESTSIARVTNLARAMEQLKDAGFRLMGAAGESETSIIDIDWSGPVAIVLGNEGRGLRRLTREHCDHLFSIPMGGGFESLNVSAAGAIAIYEATRSRFS